MTREEGDGLKFGLTDLVFFILREFFLDKQFILLNDFS